MRPVFSMDWWVGCARLQLKQDSGQDSGDAGVVRPSAPPWQPAGDAIDTRVPRRTHRAQQRAGPRGSMRPSAHREEQGCLSARMATDIVGRGPALAGAMPQRLPKPDAKAEYRHRTTSGLLLAPRRPVEARWRPHSLQPSSPLLSRCYSGHSAALALPHWRTARPPALLPTPRSMIPGSLTDYSRHLHHCRSPPPSERHPVHPSPLARNQVEPRTTAAEWEHVWSACTIHSPCPPWFPLLLRILLPQLLTAPVHLVLPEEHSPVSRPDHPQYLCSILGLLSIYVQPSPSCLSTDGLPPAPFWDLASGV
jgi:hypothetical protein